MKKLVGVLSAVALLGTGVAFAGGDQSDSQTMKQDDMSGMSSPSTQDSSSSSGYGGSGTSDTGSTGSTGSSMGSTNMGGSNTGSTTMQAPTTMGSQELTGTVIKANKTMVYVDHMGAVVPLKINTKTQFEGEAKRATDLKEGQQVRASFEIQGKTENVAKRIELQQPGSMQNGQGGSGLEGSPIQDIPSSSNSVGSDPLNPAGSDSTLRNPSTVPDQGESKGPGSPLPDSAPFDNAGQR